MRKTTQTDHVKDPENIYMSDIFHILKDQKQKIDHLLRQTKQGLQQSNSRNKGFWNSSSNTAEQFSIPAKVLNDIQGYENSAGRINSILHKKVNQLKRITMKKKTYEEIEKREREKEIFARFATPDVRMSMRNSIGTNDIQQYPPKPNKRFQTSTNTRAGSVQLENENECQTTDAWQRRIKAAKEQQKLEQLPLNNIDNSTKQNGILKRRMNDSTRASLEEITKIYSPKQSNKNKKDGLHGQSMILDSQNESGLNRSVDIGNHTMDLGMLNINSARNRQNSQDFVQMVSKDQYIDKENNQQYLLKQVQQQNAKLTQKQNEILYRQLIEQSKSQNESVSDIQTPLGGGGQRNSFASYTTSGLQAIQNYEKQTTTGNSFLPSLNISKRNKNQDESHQINSNDVFQQNDILSTQKKYGHYPYENMATPDHRYSSSIQKGSVDMHGSNSQELQPENSDIASQIKKFKMSQNQQFFQGNATKSKRSASVQQSQKNQNGNDANIMSNIDNEDRLKLLNKYKQSNLIENNTLKLPNESEIYPLNIFNDKKSDNQNFFKCEQQFYQQDGSQSLENGKMIPVNQQSLSNKGKTQRYSYDLSYNSNPPQGKSAHGSNQNGNANLNIQGNSNGKNTDQGRGISDKESEEKILQSEMQNQYQTQQQNYQSSPKTNNLNVNHINQSQDVRREYTYQDTNEKTYQIKSTDQHSLKTPFKEIVQHPFQSEAKYQQYQDQSESNYFKDPHNSNIPTSEAKQSQYQNGHPPSIQHINYQQRGSEQIKHDNSATFAEKKERREQEVDHYEQAVPNQISFTVKKEDLRLDLSKLAQKKQKQSEVKKQDQQIYKEENSQNLNPKALESVSNERINEQLKEQLQQNFLQRLGIPAGFLQRKQELGQEHKSKNRPINKGSASPKGNNNNNSSRGKQDGIDLRQGSENGDEFEGQTSPKNKIKFNDPNLFNYHNLIGCANLDEKSKRIKPYQHYHSNEREKQEKKYFEVLNEKLNYQIQINLLFLEQSLLKSKSHSKRQLLEKLKAFRHEIVEASHSQEMSIQNLKRQYKHLYSFNLPDSLFTI